MRRRELLRAFARALRAMDVGDRVVASLPRKPPRHVRLLAIGKAAPRMTAAALAAWGPSIGEALVVTTDGTDASAIEREARVSVLRAGHPVPDTRSMDAAKRCLAFVAPASTRASPRDAPLVLVLLSGGASALVCAPAKGIRFAQKQEITRALLRSGASIQEINIVRKHLSCIKGGGLARAAAPRRVVTLIASDVIAGVASDIGSGPTVADASSVADARRILRRYAPRFADLPLARTTDPSNARARIVASPEGLAKKLATELRDLSLEVRILPPSQGPVEDLAREYAALASSLPSGSAVVRVAEPSIVLPRTSLVGRGGRATHLAALVARALPRRALFLAAATDGVDGASGTAGALVDATLSRRTGAHLHEAIERYDTGPLLIELGHALSSGPSGTNLGDVHALVID